MTKTLRSALRHTLPAMAVLAMMGAAAPAAAHHSFAMFDRTKTVKVAGTVKKIELVSPHSWFWVMVPKGTDAENWGAEAGGPPRDEGQRMKAKGFVPGMKVVLEVHPYRDGRPGGEFLKISTPDGKLSYAEAGAGGPPTAQR